MCAAKDNECIINACIWGRAWRKKNCKKVFEISISNFKLDLTATMLYSCCCCYFFFWSLSASAHSAGAKVTTQLKMLNNNNLLFCLLQWLLQLPHIGQFFSHFTKLILNIIILHHTISIKRRGDWQEKSKPPLYYVTMYAMYMFFWAVDNCYSRHSIFWTVKLL